jgi:hypothetical protein
VKVRYINKNLFSWNFNFFLKTFFLIFVIDSNYFEKMPMVEIFNNSIFKNKMLSLKFSWTKYIHSETVLNFLQFRSITTEFGWKTVEKHIKLIIFAKKYEKQSSPLTFDQIVYYSAWKFTSTCHAQKLLKVNISKVTAVLFLLFSMYSFFKQL